MHNSFSYTTDHDIAPSPGKLWLLITLCKYTVQYLSRSQTDFDQMILISCRSNCFDFHSWGTIWGLAFFLFIYFYLMFYNCFKYLFTDDCLFWIDNIFLNIKINQKFFLQDKYRWCFSKFWSMHEVTSRVVAFSFQLVNQENLNF